MHRKLFEGLRSKESLLRAADPLIRPKAKAISSVYSDLAQHSK